MIRATFTITSVALILAGCSTYSPDSKAAKEFATQKNAVCCYVGMKNLPDEAAAKAAQYPDLSGQLADANRNLANKERENADLARQLVDAKADAKKVQAAQDSANADMSRQMAVRSTSPAPFATLHEKEYFSTGSAELTPEGIAHLKQLSENLKTQAGPDTVIRVEGHTDSRPIHNAAFPSNQELSSARAATVSRNLQANGIDGARIRDVGYGSTRPASPNTSKEAMASNRRVEIILTPALSTPAQPK